MASELSTQGASNRYELAVSIDMLAYARAYMELSQASNKLAMRAECPRKRLLSSRSDQLPSSMYDLHSHCFPRGACAARTITVEFRSQVDLVIQTKNWLG
jgi:hypothetical protein